MKTFTRSSNSDYDWDYEKLSKLMNVPHNGTPLPDTVAVQRRKTHQTKNRMRTEYQLLDDTTAAQRTHFTFPVIMCKAQAALNYRTLKHQEVIPQRPCELPL